MNRTTHHLIPARGRTATSFRAATSLTVLAMALSAFSAIAQDQSATVPPPAKPAAHAGPDLNRPTLYVVGYAHLDTEWRWEYPQVISEYLPKTMRANFALFEKYPHYIFNFSGAAGDGPLSWPRSCPSTL